VAVREGDGVIGGAQLQPPQAATTVRVADHETRLTDGPFMEARELCGGSYVVDADDLDAVTAIAAGTSSAHRRNNVLRNFT